MKKGTIAVSFLSLILSINAYSQCTGCGNNYQPVCTVNCCPFDTPCQCTDPGWKWNTCIDKCTYCEAFGNIGAR